ncbi:MAG: sensor histidine kinase [Planctomycetes bacterium]|nr:sensor histidine kinase [Planctomycetota bacterium]
MTSPMPQIDMGESDQLAEVIAAYTEVTERLRGSHDKLAAEVSRLRGELASKNRQLERRSRLAALGEMAAGIAHEIRNPLGGIALYAGLLGRQLADRPESLALAGRIASGVRRLDLIVNDVLAFAGEIHPEMRPVCLASVVASAAELAAGRFEQSGTRLVCEVEDGLITADAALLMRAISNLLYNAADAAGEGEVRLRATIGRQAVEIEVADSGPGIDPAVLEKIFDPFFTTKDAGTGLGLAIVHRIVESHDGRLHVSNAAAPEGLGGARFCIVLPAAGRREEESFHG